MEIAQLRAFLLIAEVGSLNRAAEQLQVAQSTLTRQMQALENEMGGVLFERRPSGVMLTAAGHYLRKELATIVKRFEDVTAEVRRQAQGQSQTLRVGYLMSAAADYVHPILPAWRQAHPETRVKLIDMSPGEQMRALRTGDIDLALIGHAGRFLTREFYVRRLASVPLVIALAEDHPLSSRESISLAELRRDIFVGALEEDMPGLADWLLKLCRKAGFRPRFVERSESLHHGLATIVSEGAVMVVPAYVRRISAPGVVFIPLEGVGELWEFYVVWQRGRASEQLKTFRSLILERSAEL